MVLLDLPWLTFWNAKPKGQPNSTFWFPLKTCLRLHPSIHTEIRGTSTLGYAVTPLKSVKARELSMVWSKNYQKLVWQWCGQLKKLFVCRSCRKLGSQEWCLSSESQGTSEAYWIKVKVVMELISLLLSVITGDLPGGFPTGYPA